MSGLKQFYMKNIKIFTIILVIIAIFVGYKCYTKYAAAQEAKKVTALLKQQQQEQKKIEGYRYGLELSEIPLLQFDNLSSVTAGLDDTPLSRIDFGTRGAFAKDELADIIRTDIKNIGESAQQVQTPSKMKDYLKYTAYGGQDISRL